jgi:Excreted virulence factor EspC, type VII ESX diderm
LSPAAPDDILVYDKTTNSESCVVCIGGGTVLEPVGDPSDFSVDPAALGGVAGRLGRAYDDMNQAVADYTGSVCHSPAAFGSATIGRAWSAFDGAWALELGVFTEAIAELIKKVETTAQNYRETDSAVRAQVGSVGYR